MRETGIQSVAWLVQPHHWWIKDAEQHVKTLRHERAAQVQSHSLTLHVAQNCMYCTSLGLRQPCHATTPQRAAQQSFSHQQKTMHGVQAECRLSVKKSETNQSECAQVKIGG